MKEYYEDPEMVDVGNMHNKFWNNARTTPTVINKDDLMARVDFIQEELNELREAVRRSDFLEQIDALVDMVVVIKGTAVMMGLPWNDHWSEVMRANMEKEVGKQRKRPNLPFDLVKPPGWCGPDHRRVLDKHVGWL